MYYDISGKIGPMYPMKGAPEWPMYSYDRPANMVWNAIAGELSERGWNDDRIMRWLQSKNPRRALDGYLGEALEAVSKLYAKTIPDNWEP